MAYRKTITEIEQMYHTNSEKGLDDREARKRLEEFGYNEFVKKEQRSILACFFLQLKDPMVLILILCTGISFLLKEWMDASIILFVIVVNACIGVVQEWKAEKAIDALENLSEPKACVVREGNVIEIPSKELVVGDVVELEVGRYIPADLRLISSFQLQVEESMLTGESETVQKDATMLYENEKNLADQKNMVFMSTYVTYGKARGIVVHTGMDSEVGKIANLLNDTHSSLTPLQIRLSSLSKMLGILSIGICFMMFLVSLYQGRDMFDMLVLSISLAVAAIPEGLPAVVTIVLAIGVQVMSQHHAIIRKLHAVETLGSVTAICSDKTGTLTQNKMHVESVFVNQQFQTHSKLLLYAMALCNDAIESMGDWLGDPTETALLAYCEKHHIHKGEMDVWYPRINEISFDSTRKKMTTVHQHRQQYFSFTKGALEKVLYQCEHVMINGQQQRLTAYQKNCILHASKQVSTQAQRVLAFAYKRLHTPYDDAMEKDMCLIGFVGMCDPIREDALEAIQICKNAGVSVYMITGDHPITALAIARQLTLAKDEDKVLTGQEIDACDDEQLTQQVLSHTVYARVTPTHKVRIVNALKANGNVVAMSGDGVNDAPSLKQADIGIAMGKNGTDVAKEASDMILADDHFSTIVKAIEEGRGVYANIQKAILYLLSCNLGEIMSLFLAMVCMPDVTTILSAVQILWINLITDSFPALALGVDPIETNIMHQRPRAAKESLFAHGGWMFTILNGMFIGTITLVAFRYGLFTSMKKGQTMAFMVLGLSQLFHAFNLRSRTRLLCQEGLFKNKWLLLTITCSILLQVLVCQLPFFHVLLKTESLDFISWFIVFALSMSILIINEISKWVARTGN